jgi:uncharacterized protein YndB with AHSA1/START domain
MAKTDTDRIEKKIHLRAPRSRVWRALTNSEEFGSWFGMKVAGAFAPNTTARGVITVPGFENMPFELFIEKMEPEGLFSYRWHPYAIDPKVDYSAEPTTLVEFRLEEEPGGTLLTVIESGFDAIPVGRRAEAFRMNSEGWGIQMTNIERYVATQ